jgi:Protein kinase domain
VLFHDDLNSAVDDVQVQLSVFGTALSRIEQHITTNSSTNSSDNSSSTVTSAPAESINTLAATGTATHETTTATAITQQQHQHLATDLASTNSASTVVQGSSNSSDSTTNSDIGTGPILDSTAYTSLESTLSQLQVAPAAITRLQDAPIGRGGFATVYKVQLKTNRNSNSNSICAAKVVKLSELTPRQLQKVYMRFAKELYILSQLQHERIVKLHGCVSTVEKLTLLMEVSSIT